MKYLRVKNWDRLQHPSEKPLPWIKFFTALLAPTKEPGYSDWADSTKALLHHIWLMARVHNNRIPETWLTRERLNLKSRVNLDPLLESGFVWFEDENGLVLSHSRARIARSGVSESKSLGSTGGAGGFDSVLAFESVWSDYPKPIGRAFAYKAFCATVKGDADLADIRTALANYRASGEVQRGFVQHGKTWFNHWRDWLKVTPQTRLSVAQIGAGPDLAGPSADDIAQLEIALRQNEWHRDDCSRDEATAYLAFLRAEHRGSLSGAPFLADWLKERKTA
jgi:hypothetical protein